MPVSTIFFQFAFYHQNVLLPKDPEIQKHALHVALEILYNQITVLAKK